MIRSVYIDRRHLRRVAYVMESLWSYDSCLVYSLISVTFSLLCSSYFSMWVWRKPSGHSYAPVGQQVPPLQHITVKRWYSTIWHSLQQPWQPRRHQQQVLPPATVTRLWSTRRHKWLSQLSVLNTYTKGLSDRPPRIRALLVSCHTVVVISNGCPSVTNSQPTSSRYPLPLSPAHCDLHHIMMTSSLWWLKVETKADTKK